MEDINEMSTTPNSINDELPEPKIPKRRKAAIELVRWRVPMFTKDFPIILLYSPKSGCTSAVNWFFWQTDLLHQALAYDKWVHRFEHEVFKRRRYYRVDIVQALCRRKKKIIKFTRDPFRRAVSSFLMLSGRQLRSPDYFGHREWEKIRQFKYGSPQAEGGISFIDFLKFIEHAGANVGKVDGHFAQQYQQAESLFDIEYFDLGNMTMALRKLELEFGLGVAPEDLTASGHHRKYSTQSDECVAEFPTHKLTYAGKESPHYSAFYNPLAIDLVRKLFRDDFEKYGYSTELGHSGR